MFKKNSILYISLVTLLLLVFSYAAFGKWERSRPDDFTGEEGHMRGISFVDGKYGWGAGDYEPHCLSCPIELDRDGGHIFVNADRLGEHSRLRVELLDREFRPIPGYSGDECVVLCESGLRQPVRWRGKDTIERFDHPIRVRVNWEGVRPEDARLFAVYVN